MKIRALKALTIRDAETGKLTSIGYGCIAEVDGTLGGSLIEEGLAEEYTLISPTGSVTITQNGETDVTQYATANVNVAVVTVTYDANGGTGTVDAVSVGKGSTITLDDGTGLTAPEGKEFAGWATSAQATEPDAESPYTATADVTLHAVWTDVESQTSETE